MCFLNLGVEALTCPSLLTVQCTQSHRALLEIRGTEHYRPGSTPRHGSLSCPSLCTSRCSCWRTRSFCSKAGHSRHWRKWRTLVQNRAIVSAVTPAVSPPSPSAQRHIKIALLHPSLDGHQSPERYVLPCPSLQPSLPFSPLPSRHLQFFFSRVSLQRSSWSNGPASHNIPFPPLPSSPLPSSPLPSPPPPKPEDLIS